MVTTREELHALIDELRPDQLSEVARYLGRMRERQRVSSLREILANAPLDDEPVTPEEEAAIAEAWEDVWAGRVISDEDLDVELEDKKAAS